MEQNQAGITALITAYCRAYHATHDSPIIFDDSLADQLFTEAEHIRFDRNLAGLVALVDPVFAATHPNQAAALARVMQIQNGPVTLSRSRYTEDRLDEAVQGGVQQYVLLGAGMDTFAFRRPDLATRLEVFEVDHPATQALKCQRIAIPGWGMPANLHLIPIDFTKQNLTEEELLRSSYDPDKISFFSWLGVTFYLPREAVFATLKAIGGIACQGSTVIFDYMDADAFIPESAGKRVQLMQAIAKQVGEPMKSGFDPQALALDLRRLGLRLQENLDPAEIEQRYFHGRSDDYHAFEHVHFAKAVVE